MLLHEHNTARKIASKLGQAMIAIASTAPVQLDGVAGIGDFRTNFAWRTHEKIRNLCADRHGNSRRSVDAGDNVWTSLGPVPNGSSIKAMALKTRTRSTPELWAKECL